MTPRFCAMMGVSSRYFVYTSVGPSMRLGRGTLIGTVELRSTTDFESCPALKVAGSDAYTTILDTANTFVTFRSYCATLLTCA